MMALARNTGCSGWYGNLEIRNKTVGSYYYIEDNDVYCDKYHPDSVFKPQYTRMGIDYRLHGLSFLDAINAIPVNPKLETLLKAKRYDLLSHWYSLRYKVSSYWPSIKICLRNKYKIRMLRCGLIIWTCWHVIIKTCITLTMFALRI